MGCESPFQESCGGNREDAEDRDRDRLRLEACVSAEISQYIVVVIGILWIVVGFGSDQVFVALDEILKGRADGLDGYICPA